MHGATMKTKRCFSTSRQFITRLTLDLLIFMPPVATALYLCGGRSEVLTAVLLKTQTGWDRTICRSVSSSNVSRDHYAFIFRVKQAKKKNTSCTA